MSDKEHEPRILECDPKTTTKIGEIDLGKAKDLTVFGLWCPGQGWPAYGPAGDGSGKIGSSYGAIVEVWLPAKGGDLLISRQLYPGTPIHIKNGYGDRINVTVRMDDPGQLWDNFFPDKNNPMRASLIEF
jgi:hypothetical protein